MKMTVGEQGLPQTMESRVKQEEQPHQQHRCQLHHNRPHQRPQHFNDQSDPTLDCTSFALSTSSFPHGHVHETLPFGRDTLSNCIDNAQPSPEACCQRCTESCEKSSVDVEKKDNANVSIHKIKCPNECKRQVSSPRISVSMATGSGCMLSRCVRLFVLTICLLACVGYSESKALSDEERRLQQERRYKQRQANVVKYLAQFGYLKGPSQETQNLRSHDDLTRAIKALQKAGGIPQTGVADSRTEALMTKPRCGNTDDFVEAVRPFNDLDDDDDSPFLYRKKRYTVATSKWPRTNLTFRFINYTPDMPQSKTRQLISDALRVWSDATPLSFTEVRDSSADIMIMFASQYHSDGYPFDGKGMVLGHAFFPGHGKGGDTHFDDDENWTTDSSDGVDLFMVAAHEFGHALGLAHSGDASALMYPWYMGLEGKFQLPEDDLRGITSLYGSGEQDRRLPDKAKVNMIPNSDTPTHRETTYDIEPSEPSGKDAEKGPADPCKSHIDALTVIRTEIFLFIGKYFWRLDSRKIITKPVEIHQFWYGLPKHLEKIDAVFERPDNKIVFFSGDRYWVFNANHPISGFPTEGRPITEFNIPADVKNIDAAFVWGYNKRTYLVSKDMYWKMNENNTFVEYDYPRDMGTWKGVPVPLDAAFRDWSGKTYFFQGLDFWEFYDMRMKIRRGYPKRIASHWMSCPHLTAQRVEQKADSEHTYSMDSNSNARLAAEEDSDDDNDKKKGHNNCNRCQHSFVILTMLILIQKIITRLGV